MLSYRTARHKRSALMCCYAVPSCSLHYTSVNTTRHPPHRDFYHVLGVKRGATAKEIKGAYYELSKKHHPDTQSAENSETAAAAFQEISEAYETLGNSDKRKAYDRILIKERSRESAQQPYYQRTSRRWESEPGSGASSGFEFGRDYDDFLEFQRKWRQHQRMTRQWHTPPEFWPRQYDAFFRYNGSAQQKRRQKNASARIFDEDDHFGVVDEVTRQRLYRNPQKSPLNVKQPPIRPQTAEENFRTAQAEKFRTPTIQEIQEYQNRKIKEESVKLRGILAVGTLSFFLLLLLTFPGR